MEAKYMTTPDDGSDPREVQTGEVGELYLRGPNIFLGYHKNPSATADSISKDGWFRTGDVGYQDFKGNFFITDRVKELIEYKGFQVAPAELRGILVGHAAVNDVAVIQLTIQLGSPENLETAPGTVGGLKQFISAARLSNNIPGLYDSRYLSLFFGNKTDGTFREPKPLGKLSAYQLNKLNKKKEDDKKNVAMVKMLHEPYWS
ncbi:AMP-dependent synthetase and ligase [Aspergillus oryzae]|uniref:AMP-dependent synthetase and ligase n=1 Tax=Aspergillus oryzae TaxID=5062 RepID=A0A1S9DK96_ASPOZ|nr:AMP-dependent synthetase and ligase [Aspergillus oryzae]